MASIISVDNIRSTGGTANIIDIDSSADTTAITIDSSGNLGDLTMNAEGGTGTTSVRQGIAKCWAHMTLGTTAIEDSLNCSSVSDDATGRFTITRTNNMDNADYSVAGAVMADRVGLLAANAADTFTASQNKFAIVDSRDAGYQDYSRACFQICGDLA